MRYNISIMFYLITRILVVYSTRIIHSGHALGMHRECTGDCIGDAPRMHGGCIGNACEALRVRMLCDAIFCKVTHRKAVGESIRRADAIALSWVQDVSLSSPHGNG